MKPPESAPDHDSERRSRVVALINPVLHCRATCAELIRQGIHLVGIVEAETKRRGLPLATFRRLLKKQGLSLTASQVAARLAYLAEHRRADQDRYRQLYNRVLIEQTLREWNGPVIRCRSYAEPAALEQLQQLRPDILVVHSQAWVTKKVRDTAASGLVIGGHPGITPYYRGSHSPFWALLNNQPDMIGWTAFHVDKGVDSGDVIVQGRLQIQPDDSYMTLNWRGMKQIAQAQAHAIREYDRTGVIPRQPHRQIPPNSEYGLPDLKQYLKYRRDRKTRR
ncbi:MAG: formyltransferase family protein [Fuerstiella sp.]